MLKKKYSVRLSDVGVHGVLRSSVLMNILQDIAAEHAVKLGFGVAELAEKRLAWFLGRLSVKVKRYPRRDEEITVITWPCGGKGLMLFRDFQISDSSGDIITEASSGWLVVNVDRRKPVRPNRAIGEIPVNPKRVFGEKGFGQISEPAECQFSETFQPRFCEIDLNNHINNSIYLTWACESMPQEILKGYVPVRMDVVFKSEVVLVKKIFAVGCLTEDFEDRKTAVHLIKQEGSADTAAQLRTVWERI